MSYICHVTLMRRIALFFFLLLKLTSAIAQGTEVNCPSCGALRDREGPNPRSYDNIITRFNAPAGYHTVVAKQGTFASYLQYLPLKPIYSRVKTYDGDFAFTDVYTAAVVNMNPGNKDLQRNAGAVIRLRAEYLFLQKRYNEIAFHLNDNFLCDYVHYAEGYRYKNGVWVLQGKKNYNHKNFLCYLELVFANSGLNSLMQDLKKAKGSDRVIAGDVFINDHSPAHCFIVMQVIENNLHQQQFLLAQGFSPAQEIQIVRCDGEEWFSLDKRSDILYGNLVDKRFLMRFEN